MKKDSYLIRGGDGYNSEVEPAALSDHQIFMTETMDDNRQPFLSFAYTDGPGVSC